MRIDDQADEIEARGFDFLKQKHWREARECFHEMLSLPIDSLRRLKVLMNVAGTYEKV